MTAAQAIKNECTWCCGGAPPSYCQSKVCKLHPSVDVGTASSVKRIRSHCMTCGEGTAKDIERCTGHVINENGNPVRWTGECLKGREDAGVCWLHPYRFGTNPDKPKRIVTLEQRAKAAACMARTRAEGKLLAKKEA